MENAPHKSRSQLDRAAWIEQAFDVLAQDGVAGLRVEVLAKKLKVTKGSFYWHFKDRQDLLDGVLEAWRDSRIRDIAKQTRARPGEELQQLYHVIDVYSASRNRKGMLIELAVREWAKRDSAVADVVREVDSKRLEHARNLFVACGATTREATSRCILLYAYVFGISLMICEGFSDDVDALKADIADLIAKARD
ncbi:MAG: TetR/AcrR family transcriptional regulator [Rhodocyclaceae bacterium]|nr:TetR/AcrR family transcriptional regulator [Rhodocyclaceae bacterium]